MICPPLRNKIPPLYFFRKIHLLQTKIDISMKKMYLILFLVLGSMFYSYAQVTVTGNVTDHEGVPIPGASILAKQQGGGGTAADFDGNFTLQLTNENGTLIVSSIGYAQKEIFTNQSSTKSNDKLISKYCNSIFLIKNNSSYIIGIQNMLRD